MSSMHVLDSDGAGKWRVALHLAIPNTNNPAGVNWRTALVNSGIGLVNGRRTVMTAGTGSNGTISAAEEASLDSGALYEHVFEVALESGGTSGAQLQATADFYTAQQTAAALTLLQSRLKYFGFAVA